MKPEHINTTKYGARCGNMARFFMSTKYESLERQWFALHAGELYALGDCGDFECALEIATDILGEDQGEWIAPYSAVVAWCDVVNGVRARFE